MVERSLLKSLSLAMVAGFLLAAPPALAAAPPVVPRQIGVTLPDTGRTIALGFGQTMVVSVPLRSYSDDTWYVYRNSPPNLKLVAGPDKRIRRNPTFFSPNMQVFYFKRVSPGTVSFVLEEKYYNKPLILRVIDGPPYVPPPPPPPPPSRKRPTQRLVLRGIHFDFDKSDIRPGDAAVLDEDISMLKANPNASIEVNGYCDAIGSEEYNLRLSERRAKAVVDYLVNSGISPDQLSPHGYGKTNFVATNETEEGRAQNRRVELVPLE
jgi:outer membrane protein OmpA-like peptidoglycan-associated protein